MTLTDEFRTVWRRVSTDLRGANLVFALAVALFFFLLVGLLPNASILAYSLASGNFATIWGIVSGLVHGIFVSAPWYAPTLLVLLSALTGVNFALVRSRAQRARRAGATGVGSLLGLVIGGCPTCATGILPLLGLTAGLSSLPMGGTEFSIIGVVVLSATLYWNATSERCRI